MKLRILSALAIAASAACATAPSPASAQGLVDIGKFLLASQPKRSRRSTIASALRSWCRPAPTSGRPSRPPRRTSAAPTGRRTPTSPPAARPRQTRESRSWWTASPAVKLVVRCAACRRMRSGPPRCGTGGHCRAAKPALRKQGFPECDGGLATLREMDRQSATASNGGPDRTEPRREFLTDPPTGLRRPADNAPFRATREGSLGVRQDPSPMDIFRDGPNSR